MVAIAPLGVTVAGAAVRPPNGGHQVGAEMTDEAVDGAGGEEAPAVPRDDEVADEDVVSVIAADAAPAGVATDDDDGDGAGRGAAAEDIAPD